MVGIMGIAGVGLNNMNMKAITLLFVLAVSTATCQKYSADDITLQDGLVTLNVKTPLHESSFVFDTELYYLQGDSVDQTLYNDTVHSFVWVGMFSEQVNSRISLAGGWKKVNSERGWLIRRASNGKIEFLQSATGDGVSVYVTGNTATVEGEFQDVIVSVDPDGATINDAVKMWVNGVAQTLSVTTNTGAYDMISTAHDITVGCWLESDDAIKEPFEGAVNQFAVVDGIFTQSDVIKFRNEGKYRNVENLWPCFTALDFDNAAFGTSWSVPDFEGDSYSQVSEDSKGDRMTIYDPALNPYSDQKTLDEPFTDTLNLYGYDNATSSNYTVDDSLTFHLDHTGSTAPDRNDCEVYVGGSFDLRQAEVWCVLYNYSVDNMGTVSDFPASHGAFSLTDATYDISYIGITHRVKTNSDKHGNYRVLFQDNGTVTYDYESDIEMGQLAVVIHATVDSFAFYYLDSSQQLIQIGTTQPHTLRYVRVHAHAKDWDAFTVPDAYWVDRIRAVRSKPTTF